MAYVETGLGSVCRYSTHLHICGWKNQEIYLSKPASYNNSEPALSEEGLLISEWISPPDIMTRCVGYQCLVV